MDQGLFEIGGARKGEQRVCMQSADKGPSKPKPLVIQFTKYATTQKPWGFQPIPSKKPIPFPYKSAKVVAWRYAPQKPDERKDESVRNSLSSAKVTNIFGTSDMTRSGQMLVVIYE